MVCLVLTLKLDLFQQQKVLSVILKYNAKLD